MSQIEKIFSYGTLRDPKVQLNVFNRVLQGKTAQLSGFKLEYLSISNPEVVAISGSAIHPVLVRTDLVSDTVDGMVFEITPNELQACDKYESADYQRVDAQLVSGEHTWIYLAK